MANYQSEYQYNMSENTKKTLTIDMSKVNSPITFNFINDTAGQVWITRNGNTATISGYAMKTVKKATVHLYAKADIYTYPTYDHNLVDIELGIWDRVQREPATHHVQWGHYEYLDVSGPFGGWDFWNPDVRITKMQETEVEISEYQCQKSTITYYTGDKNGNNLKEIGKKTFDWEVVPEEGTIREYRNPIVSILDAVDYFPGDLTNYQGGGSEVDYSRKYVQIKIINIDKYSGNGIFVNTQNDGKYSNYNIFASFDVEGTGKNNATFNGSNFSENFAGTTVADKITTGGGNDTITAGRGDDKIYISGKGDKTININQNHGNDYIYNANKADSVTLNFDTNDLYFTKSGNNLVISRAYDSDYDNMEGTVITNFFNQKNTNVDIQVNGVAAVDDLRSQIVNNNIRLTVANQGASIAGSVYSDDIATGINTRNVKAGEGDNVIRTNANNKYALNLTAGKGDDEYIIRNLDKTITITDGGGDTDIINITDNRYSTANMFLFYDIKLGKNGKYTTETSLHILSETDNDAVDIKARKGKIKDSIVVKNFQTKNGEINKGCTEYVCFSDGSGNITSSFAPDLLTLESQVVSWLQSANGGKGYASVSQAFQKADADSVQQLLNIYMTNT